jgi:hypothetical protein
MAVIPSHMKPTSKKDCVDTWRSRGRVPVPTQKGRILDLVIVRLYETTHVDGLALDLMIEGRATNEAPIKQFGVLFSDTRPQDEYPIPVLWMRGGEAESVVSTVTAEAPGSSP